MAGYEQGGDVARRLLLGDPMSLSWVLSSLLLQMQVLQLHFHRSRLCVRGVGELNVLGVHQRQMRGRELHQRQTALLDHRRGWRNRRNSCSKI